MSRGNSPTFVSHAGRNTGMAFFYPPSASGESRLQASNLCLLELRYWLDQPSSRKDNDDVYQRRPISCKEIVMKLIVRISVSLFLIIVCLASNVASTTTTTTALAQTQDQKPQSKSKSSGRVTVKYDKSKDTTTVALKTIALTGLSQERQQAVNVPLHQTDMEAFFTYSGQQMTKPVETVTLRFRVVSQYNIFTREQPLVAALDKESAEKGRAIPLGTTKYSSNVKFNSVYEEVLTISIPADALKRVAAADSIEFYLGPIGYQLKESGREALRELASRLTP
jgi:hypothetical protein